jgi:hypothetical protein
MSDAAHFDVLSGRVAIDVSRIEPALKSVAPKIENFTRNAQRSFEQLQAGVSNVGKALGGLTIAVAGASAKLIALASDANEAASKFGFVFGKAAEDTGKKLDEFAKAAGRSRYAMRDMAANIGALIGPMGFTKEKTGELSTAFAKLAVDLSSFFNVTEDDALMALKSGIVGESEPLRRFGVQLNEAKIQAEAFKLGLAKTKEEVQGAVKAQAILSIVLRETKQAQGDAIRTGDQFANSLRRAKDFAKDAATDLGQSLIPAATRLIRTFGDMAEPVKNWAQANQEVLSQRIDNAMDVAGRAADRLVGAFQSAWQVSQRFSGSLGAASEKLGAFAARAKDLWNRMPKWAQDTILVSTALLATGQGLEALGNRIPFVGEFAVSLGRIVNPLTLIKGLVAFLGPVLGVLFSPVTLTVGAAAAAIYGLYKAFQVAYERSEAFREAWEDLKQTVDDFVAAVKERFTQWVADNQETFDRIADKAAEAFGRMKQWASDAAAWLGEKIGQGFKALTGGAIPDFSTALDMAAEAASGLLDVVEAILDAFNGDTKGLASIGTGMVAAMHTATAAVMDMIANVIDGALTMLYGAIKKVLSWVAPENFVNDYMHFAEQDKDAITGVFRRQAESHRKTASSYRAAQEVIETQRSAEKKARDEQVAKRKQEAAVTTAGQEDAKYSADMMHEFGEQIAAGQVQYEREHASTVAQANQQVAQAAAGQSGETASNSSVFLAGKSGVRKNLGTLRQNNQAMLKQASGMDGAQGEAAQQAAGVISQIGQQVVEMFAHFDSLTEQEQTAAIQLNETYQKLVAQFKAGTLTQEQFNKQVKAAADAANNLANAEKELTDQEIAALNAKGILTPQQKAQQQAALQQVGEQIKQGLQGMAQQAQDQLKQGNEAYQQALDQLDQQLGDALKSGNPQQFQAAIDTLKGYAQAQIQQTLINVANTGVDPNRVGIGSIEHQGAGAPVPWQQLLSANPQAAATIKMFEGILASLSGMKIPHMAEGGVVTSPTYAMVGERGPEAVLPLNRLAQMFANPANILGNQNFRINPGGLSLNAFGLNADRLSAFDNLFGNASRILNQQLDLGNGGAQGLLDRWSQVQQQAEDALTLMRGRRMINLGGNAGWAGGAAGAAGYGNTLHFNFGNIQLANATDEQIGSLYDRIEQQALRRGYSMSSNRRNAVGNYSPNGRGSPLTPAGQAR